MAIIEPDKEIYALYFDAKGNGPTVLRLELHDMETSSPSFGINFAFDKTPGNFNVNSAPIGGGLFFPMLSPEGRDCLEALHAGIGKWLSEHPRT